MTASIRGQNGPCALAASRFRLSSGRRRGAVASAAVLAAGLLLLLLLMVGSATSAAAAPADVDALPANLQKYVPNSPQWTSSPWMTAADCHDKGGSFSRWAIGVLQDTPDLLRVFHEKDRTSSVRQDRDRDQALRGGYATITTEMVRDVPAGVCVADVKRWGGHQQSMKPFGFAWGVDPPWTPGACVDFNPRTEKAADFRNKWVGAERAPCDGFTISCTMATGAGKTACARWNAFSAAYLKKVDHLRRDAFNTYPPTGNADTDTEVKSPGEVAADAANSWFGELAKSIAKGAATLLAEAMTFWTRSDRSEMLRGPAITQVQGLLRYVGLVLLVGSVIWQGILMLYRRKPDPLISTGLGLLSFVGWSSLGGTAAVLLYEAGNALSGQVLDAAIDRFSDRMATAMQAQVAVSVAVVFLLAIVMFFLACIQWILGFFRMGALVIVLALLPTAAAGQINEATKPWLRKVLSWALSLILYQPIAAVIFSIGFVLLGQGDDIGTILTGVAVLVLAVLSMPTMLRFFDWGGARFTSGGGGGGSMALGALASVASGGAVGFSRYMDHNGPGSHTGDGNGGGDDHGALPVTPAHTGDGPSAHADSQGAGDKGAGDMGAGNDVAAHEGGGEVGAPHRDATPAPAAGGLPRGPNRPSGASPSTSPPAVLNPSPNPPPSSSGSSGSSVDAATESGPNTGSYPGDGSRGSGRVDGAGPGEA
jgi:hypothetical protein